MRKMGFLTGILSPCAIIDPWSHFYMVTAIASILAYVALMTILLVLVHTTTKVNLQGEYTTVSVVCMALLPFTYWLSLAVTGVIKENNDYEEKVPFTDSKVNPGFVRQYFQSY